MLWFPFFSFLKKFISLVFFNKNLLVLFYSHSIIHSTLKCELKFSFQLGFPSQTYFSLKWPRHIFEELWYTQQHQILNCFALFNRGIPVTMASQVSLASLDQFFLAIGFTSLFAHCRCHLWMLWLSIKYLWLCFLWNWKAPPFLVLSCFTSTTVQNCTYLTLNWLILKVILSDNCRFKIELANRTENWLNLFLIYTEKCWKQMSEVLEATVRMP